MSFNCEIGPWIERERKMRKLYRSLCGEQISPKSADRSTGLDETMDLQEVVMDLGCTMSDLLTDWSALMKPLKDSS